MAYSFGQAAYKMAFEIAPVVLTNGIAGGVTGGMLPLMSLLQSISYSSLSGGGDFGLDDTFANFQPLPGSSLIENEVGRYPFANMAIAANSIIAQPLVVSLMMKCPVRDPGGYALKLMIMTSLQNTLKQHCANGGTFMVATPSFFYTDCLLTGLHDVSSGEGLQSQISWRWDFQKPLVTLQDAASAQNAMMQALSNGTPSSGDLSGAGAINSASGASPGFLPSAATTAAAGLPAWPASFANTSVAMP